MIWQLRYVPLKFGLGDWTIFRISFPLQCRTIRLNDTIQVSEQPKPPTDPLLDGSLGYMLRALPVDDNLAAISKEGAYIRYFTLQYTHCFIDFRIGFEAYKAKFSAKTRSTISRKVRKFQEHCGGELRWATYASVDQMPEFHRLARQVSARSYQERLLDAGIPEGEQFMDELKALSTEGRVRAYILFHGESPVSYLYCPVEDGALIYAYLGYDPDYIKLSVGTVLQWLALEQLFTERRFDLFDFTEGQSDHKRLFATNESRRANVMFIRYSLWRWLIVRAHEASNRFSQAAGRWAERRGMKARLRRLLRFGLARAR